MTTHPGTPADLTNLRTLTATTLATATATALTTGDRLADAHREIHPSTPVANQPPGHTDLIRREAAFRLAHAAHLNPHGLLTPGLARLLQARDRYWPRPIRRNALLAATAHLPSAPDHELHTPSHPAPAPSVVTDQLPRAIGFAAQLAATQLRNGAEQTLTAALTPATAAAARDLPPGYGLLIDREITLRLALSLDLPATGALAPGLDLALGHATANFTSTQLADLLLASIRLNRHQPATGRTPAARHLTSVPGQGTRPCGCSCTSGGFCGGCGHAGCGRRN